MASEDVKHGATIDGKWVDVADLPVEMIDQIAGSIATELLDIYIGGFQQSPEVQDESADKFSRLLKSLDPIIIGSVVIELCANVLALTEVLKELQKADPDLPLKLKDL